MLAGVIVFKFSSDYNISDRENGFAIEADRLNKTVTKEFELKKGDTVKVLHQGDSGSWYVRIGKGGEFTSHKSKIFGYTPIIVDTILVQSSWHKGRELFFSEKKL